MTIKTQLQELFERHEVDVGAYAWMHENDRWAELIFCLLNQYNPQNAQTIRMAVSSLQYLGLLDTTKLSLLETPGNEDVVVFAHILKRHGFSPETPNTLSSYLCTLLALSTKTMKERSSVIYAAREKGCVTN